MTIGTSIFLIAVGAILRYAVSVRGDGFDIQMIGTILMIVGVCGGVVAVALLASFGRRQLAVVETPSTVLVEDRISR